MIEKTYLTNHFLIAMPALADPDFYQSVTYIWDHDDKGARGLIINHPLNINLGNVLEHMKIECASPKIAETPVLFGGPVQPERGFILHRPETNWQTTERINDEVALTTSPDILEAIAKGEGPNEVIIALGYAGWSAGQLEQEIANNYWLYQASDSELLFTRPFTERWQAAAELIGVDFTHLSGDIGHA